MPCILSAAEATLEWTPQNETDENYRVFQRQAGQAYDYDNPVWSTDGGDAPKETTCTIGNLTDEATYFFIVRAYQQDSESSDSNEVVFQAHINEKPEANAGNNQNVTAGSLVRIGGTPSFDINGDALSYQFTQTGGPKVALDCNENQCSFTAPKVSKNTIALTFSLTVSDEAGLEDTDTTVILVSSDESQQVSENDTQNGNSNPLPPSLTTSSDDKTSTLTPLISASSFNDPEENDTHLLTQWQIRNNDTEEEVLNLLSTDTHKTDLKVPLLVLNPSTQYSARVRYFDSMGLSSDWSASIDFSTGEDKQDTNNDGIPDDQEVSGHTDLNIDTIADIDQPATIKTILTYDQQRYIGINLEQSQNVTAVEAITSLDHTTLETAPPSENKYPIGLIGYKIKVSKPGDSADMVILFSDQIVDTDQVRWTRFDNINGWRNSSGTTVVDTDGYTVERSIQDGGKEDADGVANGVIIDLSGPVYPNADNSTEQGTLSGDSPHSASAGNNSCFIHAIF